MGLPYPNSTVLAWELDLRDWTVNGSILGACLWHWVAKNIKRAQNPSRKRMTCNASNQGCTEVGLLVTKAQTHAKIWECKQTLQSLSFSHFLKFNHNKIWTYLGFKFKLNLLMIILLIWVYFWCKPMFLLYILNIKLSLLYNSWH